jgi:hypothetical protein
MATRDHLERLTKQLADDGKLIEAGWIGLRIAAGLEKAPATQLDEMRKAYMAGAQHLFFSIMNVLEPGEEPTNADMRRLDLIAAELQAFGDELLATLPTAGRG